jgi:fatty acid desaturase
MGPQSATRSSGLPLFSAVVSPPNVLWPTWWAIVPYAIYSTLYASTSDSRWHETGHGTAFKTDWMNNALYEIASFMVMRESTVWRWSHNRHHSDTIIVGRDPEIAVPRPRP